MSRTRWRARAGPSVSAPLRVRRPPVLDAERC